MGERSGLHIIDRLRVNLNNSADEFMAAFRVNLAAYSKDTCGSFVTDMAEKLVDEPKNSDKESSWRFSHE